MFNPLRAVANVLTHDTDRDVPTGAASEVDRCEDGEFHSYNWEPMEDGEQYPILKGGEYSERPKIRDGYLLLQVTTESHGTCEHCGHEVEGWLAPDGYAAIPIGYHLEKAELLGAANTDPVEEPVTVDEDQNGVILVNEAEELDTFREVESGDVSDEAADDQPVAAGGATD